MVPGWLVVVLLLILVVYLYGKYKHRRFMKYGVPGPKPNFLFGILPTYKNKGLIWTDIDLIDTYGKIVGIYHGHNPVMLVADPEMIEEICVKRSEVFLNRGSTLDMGKTLHKAVALADTCHWKYLRPSVESVFSQDKLRKITTTIDGCMDNFLESIESKHENDAQFDFTRLCSAYSLDILLELVFGQKTNSLKHPDDKMTTMAIKTWKAGTSGVMLMHMICSIFPFMKEVFKACQVNMLPKDVVAYFSDVTKCCIKERSCLQSDYIDFLKYLMDSKTMNNNDEKGNKEQEGLTEEELLANAIFFIMAGYDTTANALGFLGHSLATSPSCQDLLIREIDEIKDKKNLSYDDVMDLPYLDKVVSEVLRLYPPFVRFNRRAGSDVTVHGQQVPRGMDVTVPVFALHRSKQYWTEPHKFDPDRFTPEAIAARPRCSYLPFGVGPRNCLGSKFALLEVKMAAVRILREFKFKPSSMTESSPVLQKGAFVKPENGIWIKVEKR